MKVLMKVSMVLALTLFFVSAKSVAIGQVDYPRASQLQSLEQSVGDTEIKIVYHRPNVKDRKIWGTKQEKALVPYGKVWRAGANENTTFEVTNDVLINGQPLPKGKYGFHIIPEQNEWILIFNKVNNAWGSFSYKEADDALRVKVKPLKVDDSKETLTYLIEDVTDNTANIILAWEKVRVPFKVDVGDVSSRILTEAEKQMVSTPLNAANFVLSTKQTDKYEQALAWVDNSLNSSETYFGLFLKSQLLAETGKKQEAVKTAEKAIALGKKTNVSPDSITLLEGLLKNWNSKE